MRARLITGDAYSELFNAQGLVNLRRYKLISSMREDSQDVDLKLKLRRKDKSGSYPSFATETDSWTNQDLETKDFVEYLYLSEENKELKNELNKIMNLIDERHFLEDLSNIESDDSLISEDYVSVEDRGACSPLTINVNPQQVLRKVELLLSHMEIIAKELKIMKNDIQERDDILVAKDAEISHLLTQLIQYKMDYALQATLVDDMHKDIKEKNLLISRLQAEIITFKHKNPLTRFGFGGSGRSRRETVGF